VRSVLEALEVVIIRAEERDRLQSHFAYNGPRRVRVVATVACFDWHIEPTGDGWRVASVLKRLAPVVLPAGVFPSAWSRLANLHIAYNLRSSLELQTEIADDLHRLASVVQIGQIEMTE
jgi:hypothetical protein